jgi:pseudaminic acid synthase
MKIGPFDFQGPGKCMIVAELSANHGGSKETAIKTIQAAARAGADAIKLQTYTPDTLTLNSSNRFFRIEGGTVWDGRTLYDLYKEAYTPWEWHSDLFQEAQKQGLVCFSTPFDKTATDFLGKFDPPAYKIASFEITDIPLISYVASKMKPVIISTGIANENDITLALDTCRKAGNDEIILLKCTSSYPAPPGEANLKTIKDIPERFGVPAGLSDHTKGIVVPVTAIAFGARLIEKHFILDRKQGGPDSGFSLQPEEFSEMVNSIRIAEEAIGEIKYNPTPSAEKGLKFKRSLFAVKDIRKGEMFTPGNVRSVRPGEGLHPQYYEKILGSNAKNDIPFAHPIRPEDVEI